MSYFLRFIQVIYSLYAFATFVAGLLIVSPGILIGMVLGQPRGGNLVSHLCRYWADVWLLMIGIFHRNIGPSFIDPERHYVFVANHISYLDIPVIFKAVRKNNIRVLGKIEMARIPVFGSLYRLAVVLVDRSSSENRAKSIKTLKKVLDQNISIYIFPEGTFNETGEPLKPFYDGAFRMAIETQTPIKPIVFLDTVKRMHYRSLFSLTPGRNRAVILHDVPVDGLTLDDLPALKNSVYSLMENCIIEYRQKDANAPGL